MKGDMILMTDFKFTQCTQN